MASRPPRTPTSTAIWVDTDGCVSAAEYCDVLLTSVMKGMDVAVDDGDQGRRSTAPSTTSSYVGTLENDGVGLAPYHDAGRRGRPRASTDKIEELKQQIIDGELKVG